MVTVTMSKAGGFLIHITPLNPISESTTDRFVEKLCLPSFENIMNILGANLDAFALEGALTGDRTVCKWCSAK